MTTNFIYKCLICGHVENLHSNLLYFLNRSIQLETAAKQLSYEGESPSVSADVSNFLKG